MSGGATYGSKSISKTEILNRVSTKEIMDYYLRPFTPNGQSLKKGQNISNPFLSRKQQTPSFNIYPIQSKSDLWNFHDFATGDHGDCFELVGRLHGEEFKGSLEIIARDFGILSNVNENPTLMASKDKIDIDVNLVESKWFEIKGKEFSEPDLAYWAEYQISQSILDEYGVISVASFQAFSRTKKKYQVKGSADNPIFAYPYGQNCYKIYRPFGKRDNPKGIKFLYLGSKPMDFVFGLKQAQEGVLKFKASSNSLEMLPYAYLTGGEKDVLSIRALGSWAICPNSETSFVNQNDIDTLKFWFSAVIVCYDLDKTGKRMATENSKRFSLPCIDLRKI